MKKAFRLTLHRTKVKVKEEIFLARSKWYKIENNLDLIYNMVKKGHWEYEIIKVLKISKPTWEKYKKTNTKLAETIYRAKLKRNERLIPDLELAMVKAALGHTVEETKEKQSKSSDGTIIIEKVTVIKEVPPNIGAINTLLKNITRQQPKGLKWSEDPAELDIKEEKLELEKKAAKMKEDGW